MNIRFGHRIKYLEIGEKCVEISNYFSSKNIMFEKKKHLIINLDFIEKSTSF